MCYYNTLQLIDSYAMGGGGGGGGGTTLSTLIRVLCTYYMLILWYDQIDAADQVH